jgi:hypothetical protein
VSPHISWMPSNRFRLTLHLGCETIWPLVVSMQLRDQVQIHSRDRLRNLLRNQDLAGKKTIVDLAGDDDREKIR